MAGWTPRCCNGETPRCYVHEHHLLEPWSQDSTTTTLGCCIHRRHGVLPRRPSATGYNDDFQRKAAPGGRFCWKRRRSLLRSAGPVSTSVATDGQFCWNRHHNCCVRGTSVHRCCNRRAAAGGHGVVHNAGRKFFFSSGSGGYMHLYPTLRCCPNFDRSAGA